MRYLVRSETTARWSVLLLFILVPSFFVPAPWMGVAQAKILLATVAGVVALLAWLLASLNESRLRIPSSPLLAASALVPVAYLVSALATGASWESFVGQGAQDTVMNAVVWYVLLLVSAAVLYAGYDRVPRALRAFLAGTSLVLLAQIIHLAVPSFSFGGALPIAPSSIAGSWHDLGIFLALATFVSIALLGTPVAGGYWRYVALANTLAGAFFLIVINYADVWLGFFFLCLFYAFFLYQTRAPGSGVLRLRRAWVWLALALAALGLYFGGSFVHAALPGPLQVAQIEVRPSWQGTFEIGKKVFAEPSRAFFGSGPSTFSREWGLYKPLSVNATQFWNVDFYHGVGFIPTSFVTMGVIGFLAWGAVCAALAWSLFRWFREMASGAVVRTVLAGSALYLTAFHILYVPGPALSLLTFLIFGALIAHECSGGGREWVIPLSWEGWKGRGAIAGAILFGLLVLFGGVQSARSLASDVLVNRAAAAYARGGDTQIALRSIALSLMILPNNDRAHRAGVELGLAQLSKMIAEGGGESARAELQGILNATIQHGLAAISIEDRNYQNWLTLARLYGELAGVGVEGAESSARQAYAEVLKNNPTSPLPYLGLAQLDLAKGDDGAARGNLETALRIKPDLAAAHFLLSQVEARAGNFGTALEHAATVTQIAGEDPLGWYNLGTVLYAQKNYEIAASALERAASLQSNYGNALFLLGLSYYRLDRREDALAALKVVAALNPGDARLGEMIAALEAGRSLEPISK